MLTELVNKSLVLFEEQGGEAQYRLLETVRQYARDRLMEAGEAPSVRDRHLAYFLRMAEAASVHLRGAEQAEWLARLTAEEDNLRAALEWSRANSFASEESPRLAAALGLFWMVSSSFTEGRWWLTEMLESHGGMPPAARARLLTWNGVMAFFQGDYTLVRSLLREGLALCRSEGELWHLSLGLMTLGNIAMYQGEYEAARALNDENLSLARGLNDPFLTANVLRSVALWAYRQGDYEAAAAACEESVTLFEQSGEKIMAVYSLIARAHIWSSQGDTAQAGALYRQSLLFSRTANNHRSIALALAGLGEEAAGRGELERAARLFGAEERLRTTIGVTIPPVYVAEYQRRLAVIRSGLGEDRFAAAWAEGRALSLEEAVAYALEEPHADLP